MELKDKCAIVTGAARGIGRAIALSLAAEGVNVAVADIGDKGQNAPDYELSNLDELEATAKDVAALGVKSVAIRADVTDAEQVNSMVERTIEELGGLHILVNNAGIIISLPVLAMEESQWDATLNVNLKGTFLCSKAVAGHMLGQQLGRIINVSSIAGKHGRAGISAYAASKAGVISFTESLAEELGPFNVTVNAICPGYINTELWDGGIAPAAATILDVEHEEAFDAFMKKDTPMGRPQRPEEIGEGAVFLCKADNITGVALNISGGA